MKHPMSADEALKNHPSLQMTEKSRYLDEYQVGESISIGPYHLTEEEIIDFGTKYDPQPFHIDRELAKFSPYGGLIASGFHIVSASFRRFYDLGYFQGVSLGGPGMGAVRWLKPVRANQDLRLVMTVTEVRFSQKRPDMGSLSSKAEVFDAKSGELLADWGLTALLKRRPQS